SCWQLRPSLRQRIRSSAACPSAAASIWTRTKARKKTDHFKTAHWEESDIANPLPYPFYLVEKLICRTHGSVRFCNIDTSYPQPLQHPPPTFSDPRLPGIELCVIDVVDYPAGILDGFCYGPDGLAPLHLSCSLVVT